MYRNIALTLMMLWVLAAPTQSSIGENLTTMMEPTIVGQINQTDKTVSPAEANLWLQQRTLWQERAFWTRMAIMAILQDSADKGPVVKRLMRNYEDTTQNLVPYYGNETSEKYGNLIRDNLLITADFANAVRQKDKTALANASVEWNKNVEELADFENTLGANMTQIDRKAIWLQQLNLTKNETMQLFDKDYSASIDTFDRIEELTSMMADSLANGIIRRFSGEFRQTES
jgi:hypothetical protein